MMGGEWLELAEKGPVCSCGNRRRLRYRRIQCIEMGLPAITAEGDAGNGVQINVWGAAGVVDENRAEMTRGPPWAKWRWEEHEVVGNSFLK